MSLKFKSLPLTEVCLRLAPSAPLPTDLEALSKIVHNRPADSRVESVTEQYPGFGRACLPIVGDIYGCEFWLDGNTRLIYQPNLLQVVWSNNRLKPEVTYPGFTQLKNTLAGFVEQVSTVWEQDEDQPRFFQASNLRYTNFVSSEQPASGKDLALYLTKDFRTKALSERTIHEHNLCWKEDDFNLTDVRVRVAASSIQSSKYGFDIETSAGHFFSQDFEPISELQQDHDCLEVLFTKLITSRAMKEWGYENG